MLDILLNVALITAIIAFLGRDKETKLKYITLERRDWRERLREKIPKLIKSCIFNEDEKEKFLKKLNMERDELIDSLTIREALLILEYKYKFDIEHYRIIYINRKDEIIDERLKKELMEYISEPHKVLTSGKTKEIHIKLLQLSEDIKLIEEDNYLIIKNNKEDRETSIEILNLLLISINPYDIKDAYLREEIKKMLKYKVINREKFTINFSNLLKSEWDKSKNEAKNLKEFWIYIGVIIFFSLFKINKIYEGEMKEKSISKIQKQTININIYDNSEDEKKDLKENGKIDLSGNKVIGNTSEIETNGIKELNLKPEFTINTGNKKGKKQIEKFIYFDFDESNLSPSGVKVIDEIVSKKKENESIILIGGADTVGTEKYNLLLKAKRVETIQKALYSRGIQPKEIDTKITSKEFVETEKEIKEPLNKAVKIVLINDEEKNYEK